MHCHRILCYVLSLYTVMHCHMRLCYAYISATFYVLFLFFLYASFTHNAHRVIGVRVKPPSHEANMKALLGRETRKLEKNPSTLPGYM